MKRYLLAIFSTLLLVPMEGLHAADAAKSPRPLLFANYYIWYRAPDHPKYPWLGWIYKDSETNPLALKARRVGEPPLNTPLRPLAGHYDSMNPAVAERHVQLAKAAGIDAFLVSWWGGNKEHDKAFENGVFAAAVKHGFKVAMLDELAQFHGKLEDYQRHLVATLRKYKDSPAYLKIDGKPVVYLYQVGTKPKLTPASFAVVRKHVETEVGPVYWIMDKIAHTSAAQKAGNEDRLKSIPRDWLETPGVDAFGFYSTFSNFKAHQYEELAGKYRYLTDLAHTAGKKMLLPVHPGHDNSHHSPTPYAMPRRDGQTLRDFLRAATDGGADYVMVTSWNEWPESTVVEPSSSWPDPCLYLKILAEWKGVNFIVPPLPNNRK